MWERPFKMRKLIEKRWQNAAPGYWASWTSSCSCSGHCSPTSKPRLCFSWWVQEWPWKRVQETSHQQPSAWLTFNMKLKSVDFRTRLMWDFWDRRRHPIFLGSKKILISDISADILYIFWKWLPNMCDKDTEWRWDIWQTLSQTAVHWTVNPSLITN